jgi:hypothetical protein
MVFPAVDVVGACQAFVSAGGRGSSTLGAAAARRLVALAADLRHEAERPRSSPGRLVMPESCAVAGHARVMVAARAAGVVLDLREDPSDASTWSSKTGTGLSRV